jgi:hypothetical protein
MENKDYDGVFDWMIKHQDLISDLIDKCEKEKIELGFNIYKCVDDITIGPICEGSDCAVEIPVEKQPCQIKDGVNCGCSLVGSFHTHHSQSSEVLGLSWSDYKWAINHTGHIAWDETEPMTLCVGEKFRGKNLTFCSIGPEPICEIFDDIGVIIDGSVKRLTNTHRCFGKNRFMGTKESSLETALYKEAIRES